MTLRRESPDNLSAVNRETTDSEFGIACVVPEDEIVHLFGKPPQPKKISERLFRQKPRIYRLGTEKYPAFMVSDDGKDSTLIFQELKPGQKIIARKIPGRDDVLEVITYIRKPGRRSDMPESGNEIEITQRGYVYADAIKRDPAIRQSFQAYPSPFLLFPHENLITDVNQSIFGDCFLLSSLLAILRRPNGAHFIRHMIEPDGEGFSRVRLFDLDKNDFVYVRVENSYYCENGESTVNHRAPWVHILEKAYTAHAYKKSLKGGDKHFEHYRTFPAFHEMFGGGGQEDFALKILTGETAQVTNTPLTANFALNAGNLLLIAMMSQRVAGFTKLIKEKKLIELDDILNKLRSIDKRELRQFLNSLSQDLNPSTAAAKVESLKALVNDEHFGPLARFIVKRIEKLDTSNPNNAAEFLDTFAQYLCEFEKLFIGEDSGLGITKMLPNISQVIRMGQFIFNLMQNGAAWNDLNNIITFSTDISIADILSACNKTLTLFNNLRLPADLLTKCVHYYDHVAENISWNGNLGTGFYTEKTLAIYNDIFQKCSDNSIQYAITAATKSSDFPQHGVPGLRGNHAYCVISAFEQTVESGATLKFIRLRNPWGRVGMKYQWSKLVDPIITENEAGAEFDIELSDFVKYFANYSVGKVVPVAPRQQLTPPVRSESSDISESDSDSDIEMQTPPSASQESMSAAKKIAIASGVGAGVGALVGLGLGVAAATVLAIPTFGLSYLTIPVFMAVGAGVGALLSCVTTAIGCAIESCCTPKRPSQGNYQLLPSEDPSTHNKTKLKKVRSHNIAGTESAKAWVRSPQASRSGPGRNPNAQFSHSSKGKAQQPVELIDKYGRKMTF